MSMLDRTDSRLRATAVDLPSAVAEALARPASGEEGSVDTDGTAWGIRRWADPAGRPLLLVHGVTSSARIW